MDRKVRRKKLSRSARNVLTVPKVRTLTEPGWYADGGNLYLKIGPEGGKSWVFRYYTNGRQRYMGLGPAVDVTLADARAHATGLRAKLREGVDPLEERAQKRADARHRAFRSVTFSYCARQYMDAKAPEWTLKHLNQWDKTLSTYAMPKIGGLPVAEIELDHVHNVLKPIWTTKTETANRVRGRIESVLDWATVMKYRTGDNPARWKGNLKHLLASPGKVAPKEHLAALHYDDIQPFIAELRGLDGVAPRALEFTILTAARTSEVIMASWEEFDLDAALWTVPGERTKSGRVHRVPLSPRAMALIQEYIEVGSGWVFPGHKKGSHLSNMAMLTVVKKRMARSGLTVHGFRSTFRDWCAEQTSYPSDVAEMALSHVVDDKTEAAYRRGDLFSKRERLMRDWSRYCEKPKRSKVATLRRAS